MNGHDIKDAQGLWQTNKEHTGGIGFCKECNEDDKTLIKFFTRLDIGHYYEPEDGNIVIEALLLYNLLNDPDKLKQIHSLLQLKAFW